MSRALRRLHVLVGGDQVHATLTLKWFAALFVSFRLLFRQCSSLTVYDARWAKFAGLADTFAEKRGAIFDRRLLQNLDLAN